MNDMEKNTEFQPIGSLLKRLREGKGLSQRKLARLANIDRGYICQLEAGRQSSVSLKTAHALARGLGISPEVFLKPENERVAPRTPDEILRELMVSQPVAIPVYDQPFSLGAGAEPTEYAYWAKPKAAKKNIIGVKGIGDCLSPKVNDGDTLFVDTDASPVNGSLVACSNGEKLHVAVYRESETEKWLETNQGRAELDNCHVYGVVVEINRKIR